MVATLPANAPMTTGPRFRPWTLDTVTVAGGWKVMWTRWIWDWREEAWDQIMIQSPDRTIYPIQADAEAALTRFLPFGGR